MRVRLAIPENELDDHEKKDALDAALEAVTRTTEPLVRNKRVPLAAQAIKGGLVKWQPEPPGDEHFDLPTTVLARKWGDCDDLAPWHAASLRAAGNDPGARAIVRKSGPNRWHAVVQRSDGSIDDPSRAAGMGRGRSSVVGGVDSVVGAAPSVHAPMHDARLCAAIYPFQKNGRRGWIARVDVPDSGFPWHWSGLSVADNVHGSLVGAIQTARAVAENGNMNSDDECRLGALEDLLSGEDPDEVAEALQEFLAGEDAETVMEDAMVVGGFFDHIAHMFRPVTRPIAHALHPLDRLYSKVSPYTTALFPATAAIVDPIRSFAKHGNILDAYKSTLIPGTESARDVFERNPLGHVAYGAMKPLMSSIPGASTWLAAAAPRDGGGVAVPGQLVQQFAPGGAGDGLSFPDLSSLVPGMPQQAIVGGPVFMRF